MTVGFIMAAVVAVKKEMRKKIKTILKDVSDAAAATQSTSPHVQS
jgi:5-formyltetrahydrofolate cyclo-ligase